MKTFSDTKQRKWTIEVTVGTLKRVKGKTGHDLMEVVARDGKLLASIYSDPVVLCDIVYECCRREADRLQIVEEDFMEAIAGDSLDSARVSFMEALVDFFPGPPMRAAVRAVVAEIERHRTEAMTEATRRIESGEMRREMEDASRTSGDTSGHSPESSESTRTA